MTASRPTPSCSTLAEPTLVSPSCGDYRLSTTSPDGMSLGAPPDFPASVVFPEGHYLKVDVLALD